MQLSIKIPSSPSSISSIVISMSSTLKNTLCGGDVNFIKVRDPALLLPHLSLLLLKWKSQIGEECVIQVVEQD